MAEQDFLTNLGFDSNPFQYTDADQEDRLSDYFVPPPYFDAVFGDPSNPTSSIVFAPRGSGKSAQRRMVEIQCQDKPIVCVTYDTFDFLTSNGQQEISLDDHLTQILRIALIGVLTNLREHTAFLDNLDQNQKKTLQLMARLYLDSLGQLELRQALDSLKSLPEKAKEIWNENFWLVNSVGSFILQKIGLPLEKPTLGQGLGESLDPSPRLHLDLLGRIAERCGITAVYVLVDKIDETATTTNNPEAAYRLVAPLIEDLNVLGARPFCFKFFLPDNLSTLHQHAARADRIEHHRLKWTWSELKTILERRLGAHSGGKVTRPAKLVSTRNFAGNEDPKSVAVFLDLWVYRFAESSPRDLIRIWQEAVAEQQRIDPEAREITWSAMLTGLDAFCRKRSIELVPERILAELSRLNRVDFTTNYVANEVFKINANSARNKITAWVDTGAVARQPDRAAKKRPAYHYAVEDPRVARTMLKNMSAESFWVDKMSVCPRCDALVLRDWDLDDSHICRQCSNEISYSPRS